MNLDTIADICYKDSNSDEIRVYNSNEYGGISEYNENQI